MFKNLLILLIIFLVSSCGGFKKVDTRKVPINSQDRARKNDEEGKGVSITGMLNNRGTNYEFSSSNPLWRASLEVLDFLPFSTVDYSGGVLITDWYNVNSNENSSIKITLRFLSNEVRADSLKIIVHEKKCIKDNNCKINTLKSKISMELSSEIIKKAAILEKQIKK